MKNLNLRVIVLVVSVMTGVVSGGEIDIKYIIDTENGRGPISEYIYGGNEWKLDSGENLTVQRIGGNRMTTYNWENNCSNAGEDWQNLSDLYLAWSSISEPEDNWHIPGRVLTHFHEKCQAAGQDTVLTLQMAGYVAADPDGPVEVSEAAPSPRWKKLVSARGAPFCHPPGKPDLTDDTVYMDELVNLVVSTYGNASTPTGVKYYSLDNEPSLWAEKHDRIHPVKVTCKEVIEISVALSRAIKNVDPYAMTLGGVLYGFNGYNTLQDAVDWEKEKQGYTWFLDYYLDKMKAAGDGKRLLDILDLHWYPEAQGDGIVVKFSAESYSQANAEARMQSPRTLWDPDYIEDSWIGQWFSRFLPLLPTVQKSIEKYYPGTKLSITEYCYGAGNHISGGITQVDVLGIFGKYGLYMANYWHLGGELDYISAAFKLYRNYDGKLSTYGDTKVAATMSDKVNSSVYASVSSQKDDKLHLIILNKNYSDPINGTFTINSKQKFTSGEVWGFNDSSPVIKKMEPVTTITDNGFSYTIPPLTARHIVLKADSSPKTSSAIGNENKTN
ncbi:MAG: glycoside hydrolase family 44 protein [Sedimentisphaerales bacterium]|nr:glycoside hydrolase family 44 protein [Sedimentisphaerales bacterium]